LSLLQHNVLATETLLPRRSQRLEWTARGGVAQLVTGDRETEVRGG